MSVVKVVLAGAVLFVLTGCGAKEYYMLSSSHMLQSPQAMQGCSLAIEKISLPQYLHEGRVPFATSAYEIRYRKDAMWAVDLEEDLTQALLFDLKRSFPALKVHYYPWEGGSKRDVKVKISVKSFIAKEGKVVLDGLIRIDQTERVVSLQEPLTGKSTKAIVEGMQKLFARFEDTLVGILDDIGCKSKRRK